MMMSIESLREVGVSWADGWDIKFEQRPCFLLIKATNLLAIRLILLLFLRSLRNYIHSFIQILIEILFTLKYPTVEASGEDVH